ncbi:DNA-binding protein [Streptococcus parauberis]|uniref:HTH-type transcriptional regulator Xre n=1 Tax=Streptococcus parauberis TaxID=1348 RepID=A0A0E2UH26_9STRE|nr:helix-turn-helix transcriptional regulator [Streptococcus parauberis]AEF24535.1 DNA-binding protein [Streptococcus parauberis KCTC 11537]MDT2748999.1 helix-turn-helix transcriptional regulator [Streptococcus parauberis]PCH13144.1 HTH-type transcriptional regulator Xre [Streptococcus parauberis]WEM63375.1 helix-turn-helix transcriptional regulator [Streptococcus parauberis]GAJ62324.1 DNA-binding protein [Streptococcus parauberis]
MKLIFSQQLAKLRKEKHFSQDELAEKLFISRQAISKWERGEVTPDLAKIEQIAEVFGVTTEFLLFGKNFEDTWGVESFKYDEFQNMADEKKEERFDKLLDLFRSYWWLLFPFSGLLFALIEEIGKLFD